MAEQKTVFDLVALIKDYNTRLLSQHPSVRFTKSPSGDDYISLDDVYVVRKGIDDDLSKKISNASTEPINRPLCVVGDAGSGKTSVLVSLSQHFTNLNGSILPIYLRATDLLPYHLGMRS